MELAYVEWCYKSRERDPMLDSRRNKALLYRAEFGDEVRERLPVELGQCYPRSRAIQSMHVLVGSKETYSSLGVFVCLHAFEALERIMEDAGCGVQREVLVGQYTGRQPTGGGSPLYREHMVCRQNSVLAYAPEDISCLTRASVGLRLRRGHEYQ